MILTEPASFVTSLFPVLRCVLLQAVNFECFYSVQFLLSFEIGFKHAFLYFKNTLTLNKGEYPTVFPDLKGLTLKITS